MTSATSRESPRRFIRMLSFQLSTSLRSVAAWKGVSMVPGETMFTRMPNSARSLASAREYAGGVITQMPIVEDPEVFLQMKSLPQQKEASALWSSADTSMILPQLYFSSEITTENANNMSEINTYVAEQFNKYVMGIESLDTFDQFQQQLKDMGIETVLANYQASYDAVYKS